MMSYVLDDYGENLLKVSSDSTKKEKVPERTFIWSNVIKVEKSKGDDSRSFGPIKKNKRGEVVKNLNSFKNKISKVLRNGDYLMIKGSNATGLSNLSKKFIRGY